MMGLMHDAALSSENYRRLSRSVPPAAHALKHLDAQRLAEVRAARQQGDARDGACGPAHEELGWCVVVGCAPGCPWCAHKAQQEGSSGAAAAAAAQPPFKPALGSEYPVPCDSPFMWRLLWWGLLGRVSPRTQQLLKERAGMCPHSCDADLWRVVYHTVCGAIPWGDHRTPALAGLDMDRSSRAPCVTAVVKGYAEAINDSHGVSCAALRCAVLCCAAVLCCTVLCCAVRQWQQERVNDLHIDLFVSIFVGYHSESGRGAFSFDLIVLLV